MNVGDTPQFATAAMATSTYAGDAFNRRIQTSNFIGAGANEPSWAKMFSLQQMMSPTSTESKKENTAMAEKLPACRLVRVIVVDTHDSVPMEQRVLFMGSEKMTDATDEELFFEIAAELNAKLKAHNELRITYTEKKNAADPEKAKKLEPARIRDLKMTVVSIASF